MPQTVPDTGRDNFADAPSVDIGPAAVPLCGYQQRWLADTARIKVAKWARQTGKDFTTSLEAVLDALETHDQWYIISLTQRQADATAAKAAMHCRALQLVPEISSQTLTDSRGWQYSSSCVRVPGGGSVTALPGRDPDALAGLTGHVIFTEMALFPDKGTAHWRVVFPLITRGFKLRAISTPRGADTKFAELCRNAQGNYSVHVVDIHQAVADGLQLRDEDGADITPEELRAIYADEYGWRREYLVQEASEFEPLIDWQYIYDCSSDYTIARAHVEGPDRLRDQFDPETAAREFFAPALSGRGTPVLGFDIAATGHLSALAFGEKVLDTTWLRALVTMHRCDDFDYQEAVVRAAMETGAVGVGDKSGIGRATCNALEKDYGEHRFRGLVFSGSSKGELGTGLMRAAQSARLRIPQSEEDIGYDLHAIGRDSAGAAQFLVLREEANPLLKQSHCDIAYSLAMMIDAGAAAGGPIDVQTVGLAAAPTAHEHPVNAMRRQRRERLQRTRSHTGVVV